MPSPTRVVPSSGSDFALVPANMPPVAESEFRPYFITFTTYGARLHGDARGSIDRWHNRYEAPRIEARLGLEAYERTRLKSEAVVLDAARRGATDAAIRERCRFMGWHLWAVNVRTNHVHVVVSAGETPEKVMNSFKARATTAMRAAGLVGPDDRVWARHGSTRRLTTQRDIEGAVAYVVDGQGPNLSKVHS